MGRYVAKKEMQEVREKWTIFYAEGAILKKQETARWCKLQADGLDQVKYRVNIWSDQDGQNQK